MASPTLTTTAMLTQLTTMRRKKSQNWYESVTFPSFTAAFLNTCKHQQKQIRITTETVNRPTK
jgi:hypothetical protein